jgi:predicted ester cyclase
MNNQDTPSTQQVLDRNLTTLNARDIDGYLANQQPDVEFVLSGGATLYGREEIRHYIEALWKAFPDGKLAFGAQVFADDAAATELVFTGTHTGPLMTPGGPIPPTGNHVTLHSASILHIKEGLIAWEHLYSDQLELLTQLGLMPAAPSPNNHSV